MTRIVIRKNAGCWDVCQVDGAGDHLDCDATFTWPAAIRQADQWIKENER